MTNNSFLTAKRSATVVAVISLLGACGGGIAPELASTVVLPAFVVSTALDVAPLTVVQHQQISDAVVGLTEANALTTLDSLSALEAVVGYNPDLSRALGAAQVLTNGLGTAQVKATVTVQGALATINQYSSYVPTTDGQLPESFTNTLLQGSQTLSRLVPPGTRVGGLSVDAQKQVAVVASVQTLRVLTAVLGTGTLISFQSAAQDDAAITTRYTQERQAQLREAANVLLETGSYAKATLSDGSVMANAVIDSVFAGLNTANLDGDISTVELQGLAAAARRLLVGV